MSIGIKFSDSGIAQGLSTYDVTVPTYQRDYSWKTTFVSTFLEDISLAIQTDESVYFLGSLVFIDRGENMREVVDGQQRLATTSLLLASMRQISGITSDISRGIERMILSGNTKDSHPSKEYKGQSSIKEKNNLKNNFFDLV